MILTGKASKDFIKWLHFKHNLQPYNLFNEIIQYSLIIEWFDSVGICIDRDCINMEMVITDFRDVKKEQTIIDCGLEEPFQYWWKKAIKKANKIYNNKN